MHALKEVFIGDVVNSRVSPPLCEVAEAKFFAAAQYGITHNSPLPPVFIYNDREPHTPVALALMKRPPGNWNSDKPFGMPTFMIIATNHPILHHCLISCFNGVLTYRTVPLSITSSIQQFRLHSFHGSENISTYLPPIGSHITRSRIDDMMEANYKLFTSQHPDEVYSQRWKYSLF